MKVLQICHKPPFPAKDGGTRAMHNITMGLISRGHEVKVLTAYTHKHGFDLQKLPQEYVDQTSIEAVFIDTRINAVEAFASLITSDSYNVSRFFSADLDRKLTKLLRKEKFDIIHLESLFVTPYLGTIRRHSKAKVILRSHNIEYRIWRELAEGTRNMAKRAYLKYLANKLEEYERSVLEQVDGIAAISSSDFENFKKLGYAKPMKNIPFGVQVSNNEYLKIPKEKGICYIGSMDWKPNAEGLVWFLEDVWPSIHKAHPDLIFYIAGKNMPEYLERLGTPNVNIVGEVPDAKAFLAKYEVSVVPLLMSGGLRIRVIEAMSIGSCVITTRSAAKGLHYEAGKHLLLADTASEFTAAIERALMIKGDAKVIGDSARLMIEDHYNIERVLNELELLYSEVLA